MFNYKTNLENLDKRAVFANSVFKGMFNFDEELGYDLDEIVKSAEFKSLYENFTVYVSHIIELVDTEIPLMAYYILQGYRWGNPTINQEKYEEALTRTREACKLYYQNNDTPKKSDSVYG